MHPFVRLLALYLLLSVNFKQDEGRLCDSCSVLSKPPEYNKSWLIRDSEDITELMADERRTTF